MAPTYRNDGTGTVRMTNFSGEMVNVHPGHSIETEEVLTASFLTEVGLTLTSASPYYNPVIASTRLSSSGEDKTHAITKSNEVKRIRFQQVRNTFISVYLTAKANLPAIVTDWGSSDGIFDLVPAHPVNTLVVSFSGEGSCYVVEMKE